MATAVILHLSDIQFGAHHRFTGAKLPEAADAWSNTRYGSNDSYHTLFAKLHEDLMVLKKQHGLVPNCLVISGDLAEWGLQTEYKQVRVFLDSLLGSKAIRLTKNRTVLVPGNHDVNWSLSESYFHDCHARRTKAKPPYWKKFRFWNAFLDSFYGATGVSRRPVWYGRKFAKVGVFFVALNSCMQESHRQEDHYGFLGTAQVNEAMDWCEQEDPDHQLVRIAVLHHNVVTASNKDEESLRDWDDVRARFEASVDIVLHGHRHEQNRSILGNLSGRRLVILAAGSAGLDGKALPSSPNQYQVITVNREQGHVYLRSYNEAAFGPSGRGYFRPDTDPQGRADFPFVLPSVTPSTPPAAAGGGVVSTAGADLGDYCASMRVFVHERLNREEGKVGSLIALTCRDMRTRAAGDLGECLRAWLRGTTTRMVVLGAAGSGKTVSSLQVCRELLTHYEHDSWLPLYLDLGRHSACDHALDIIREHFRTHGLALTRDHAQNLLRQHKVVLCLDGFDEYEKSGLASVSERSFAGFEHLAGPNTKVLITCRSNFFRRPEEILYYDLQVHTFELCPSDAVLVEILPLDRAVVSSVLQPYVTGDLPDWLCRLAERPLSLRMLLPLLRVEALDTSRRLHRHELYERFISYVLAWDLKRWGAPQITVLQSRRVHVALAERFLAKAVASLPVVDLFDVVEQVLNCRRIDERFPELLAYFQESGLIRFAGGEIVFSHKSFREYLVARGIADLISAQDDTFDFIWFTRNERDYIVEILSSADKETLCRWLTNEERYPACNYASFILGGSGDVGVLRHLIKRLHTTADVLVKINCANAVAALGHAEIRHVLMGAVAGYALEEALLTIAPSGCDPDALMWVGQLNERFGRAVMLIHICESIDALAVCGDERALDVLKVLDSARDRSVADEARAAVRPLVNRLSEQGTCTDPGHGTVTRGRRRQRRGPRRVE